MRYAKIWRKSILEQKINLNCLNQEQRAVAKSSKDFAVCTTPASNNTIQQELLQRAKRVRKQLVGEVYA